MSHHVSCDVLRCVMRRAACLSDQMRKIDVLEKEVMQCQEEDEEPEENLNVDAEKPNQFDLDRHHVSCSSSLGGARRESGVLNDTRPHGPRDTHAQRASMGPACK